MKELSEPLPIYSVRMMRNIPIKNIYYIVLYAWDRVKHQANFADRGIEKIDSINDVLLDIFLHEVEQLTKKGLRSEYVTDIHHSRFIKGKIHINETIRQTNQMIVCEYDEFELDHPLNQILKAFLQKLYYIDTLEKKRIRRLLLHFESVTSIDVTPALFKGIHYTRLTAEYRFPIEVGKLLYEHAIPSEKGSELTFHEIMENEEVMSDLFERFIFNYYRIHFPYVVQRRQHRWDLMPLGESNFDLIPTMNTDVEIQTPTMQFIIDAKFYQSAFTRYFDKERFRSSHMYQMTSYMQKRTSTEKQTKGILMYPSNGYEFYEQYRTGDGNILSFKTVNLAKDWKYIEADLADIFVEHNQN